MQFKRDGNFGWWFGWFWRLRWWIPGVWPIDVMGWLFLWVFSCFVCVIVVVSLEWVLSGWWWLGFGEKLGSGALGPNFLWVWWVIGLTLSLVLAQTVIYFILNFMSYPTALIRWIFFCRDRFANARRHVLHQSLTEGI